MAANRYEGKHKLLFRPPPRRLPPQSTADDDNISPHRPLVPEITIGSSALASATTAQSDDNETILRCIHSFTTRLRADALGCCTHQPHREVAASGTTATSSRMLRRPTLESGAGPSMPGPTTSVPPSTLPTLPFVSEEHEDSEVRQVTTGANDGQLLQNENGLFAAPRSFGMPPPMDTLSSGLQPNGPPSQQPSQQPTLQPNQQSTLQPNLQPNLQHSYSQESLRSSNGSFHDTGLSGGGKCHACFLSTESRAHAHPFPVFLCLLSLSLQASNTPTTGAPRRRFPTCPTPAVMLAANEIHKICNSPSACCHRRNRCNRHGHHNQHRPRRRRQKQHL